MENTGLARFQLSGFMMMCVAALSACTGVTDAGDDAFDSGAVDAIGDKVADWQLANLDDLSYIRSAPGLTTRIEEAGNTAPCTWA